MFYFARPKLLGLPVSVKSFTQFGETLHINAKSFMHLTGVLELTTALVLFVSIFLSNRQYGNLVSSSGYILLLGTMVGALITEFKVRPEPVPFLVKIAITLIFIAVSQLILAVK